MVTDFESSSEEGFLSRRGFIELMGEGELT